MEQQVHKKTSALTIVGIIVLILGFMGIVTTLYGYISRDRILSNLDSQIKAIDADNEQLKKSVIEPYEAKSSHTQSESFAYTSAVNQYNTKNQTRNGYAKQYNEMIDNTNIWLVFSVIVAFAFIIVGTCLITTGKKKSGVAIANTPQPMTTQAVTTQPMAAQPVVQKSVPTPIPAEDEVTVSLKKLKTLFDDGLISEAEYNEKKAQILEKL